MQNYVPSISGITGVSPQRYVWRICIALHSTPRFVVGFAYYNYYMARMNVVAEKHCTLFRRLVNLNFWFYTIENAGLVGVTYIANVENYRKQFPLRVNLLIRGVLPLGIESKSNLLSKNTVTFPFVCIYCTLYKLIICRTSKVKYL